MEKCICKNCGKEFLGRTKKQCFYCCDECKKQYKNSHRKTYTHICDNCGIKYQNYIKSPSGKHTFCSHNCSNEFHSKQYRDVRKCEICGKEFIVTKSRTQRFCSIQCQGVWQSKYRRGINASNYRLIPHEERVKKCEYCGDNFTSVPSHMKTARFCSDKCRQDWYANVWSQRDEWREESSIRATKMLSDGLISQTNTTPQKIVNDMLSTLNIEYINEENFKYVTLDNYIPFYNLGIEVMGGYWHCDHRMFPIIKYQRQKDRIVQDKRKRTYLKNNYGFEVLYLWEKDINENPQLCLELINLYIKSNGVLANYHSFNYTLQYDKIILNQNPSMPYMEYKIEELSNICKINNTQNII